METKWCAHCGVERPVDQFYRNRKSKLGLTVYCKAYYAEYYAENSARQRATSRRAAIKRRYGLEADVYDALIKAGCSICGETEKRIVMDHCHATNAVRAPLCDQCNQMLGNARDDPEILRAGATYLERHATG